MIVPVRGRVYWADVGYGEKPWLCVSNNARNRQLESCLAVRITTSTKPPLDSVIALERADPLVGSILCDDMIPLFRDEITREGGALSVQTMLRLNGGLRAALALA